jgi:hypothetical protein
MVLSFFENFSEDELVDYKETLSTLVNNRKISEYQYSHFLNRGITVITPERLGLNHLSKFLPCIVIAACSRYIEKMKIPYQATSFVGAKIDPSSNDIYVYKLPGKPAGGVPLLTGNREALGDNLFASIHRILLGSKGVLVSASNARSKATFIRLKIIYNFDKKRISVLNPKNGVKVIFITNQEGYEYAEKKIRLSETVDYIVTGKKFNIFKGMVMLRKLYGFDVLLNDGGRQMSNGLRDVGLVAEERITLEPYPGPKIFPGLEKIDPMSILAVGGTGYDGGEIEGTIRINSISIGREKANVYAYPLDDNKVIFS